MADVHIEGHTIRKTRSRLWGTCYKIIRPDGSTEVWSGRDPVYHDTVGGAYWYIIRRVQDILLNQLDAIQV